jgi:alpha-galactosidase
MIQKTFMRLKDNTTMNARGLSRRAWMAIAGGGPAMAYAQSSSNPGFLDVLRPPDFVTAFTDAQTVKLSLTGSRWKADDLAVETEVRGSALRIRVTAEKTPLMRVRLRWSGKIPERWRILNDQWERMSGERVLPWYFLAFDGRDAYGCGVETAPSCFAFWQVDPAGITLWLDLRNGGSAVHLRGRILEAATVRTQRGDAGESAFQVARRLCHSLCDKPRLASEPVYGGNNWYYAYGHNCSAGQIERDAGLMAELAPAVSNRPFMVIDDGWSVASTAGPWEHGNVRFPDMAELAASIKRRGVRPGIWLRPLYTTAEVPQSFQLRPRDRKGGVTLDPTVPEVAHLVRQDMGRMVKWGYELLKHDFSSFDLLGRWGFAMGPTLTGPGWHFSDRTKTTAEVVLDLYRTIRESSGDALVIGCNTFGHLAAGLFELQRTGDDTSGREFDRTRRMGVNTLAFRGPQHRTFFDVDADCAAITPQLPWKLASEWLDLVARSGTALFVSPDPEALNNTSKRAIRNAFATAANRQEVAEPLDWMETTTPERWRLVGQTVEYDWFGAEGGSPFTT